MMIVEVPFEDAQMMIDRMVLQAPPVDVASMETLGGSSLAAMQELEGGCLWRLSGSVRESNVASSIEQRVGQVIPWA